LYARVTLACLPSYFLFLDFAALLGLLGLLGVAFFAPLVAP
jgi:hypothetical protein